MADTTAERLEVDLCVIGGGTGGLSVAAGAAQMGASVVLIERGKMGGDCLNYGCVPSKALLAAAHAAHRIGAAARFGVAAGPPRIDFQRVHDHVHEVIAAIAPHDSQERFEGLGVRVIRASANFVGPQEVAAGGVRVQARRIVVATGSRAAVPPIPGLDQVAFLTNETVFEQTRCPEHLIVIGGGPIGVEMAQAFRRLGAAVTVLEMASILPKDDAELVAYLRRQLVHDGIALHEGVKVAGVAAAGATNGAGVAATVQRDGKEERIAGSHLLVATGRRPNLEDLNLEAAGIAYTPQGITVDAGLRTSNRKVYAIGDTAGGAQFTHLAGYHASVVLRRALFRLPAKADTTALPWVTYSDPELAHVGLGEAAARDRYGTIRILRWSFAENDRAQATRQVDGMIKVITAKRGRVLGASIVGPEAGELILPWVLAVADAMPIRKMARIIAPYPTLGEVGKRAAGSYYAPSLFSERTRSIVRLLGKLG